MEDVFSHVGIADIHTDLCRNIVSLRVSQDLFDDLSDDPADWVAAQTLESFGKPGLFVSATPILHRPFEEAAWNDAIHYPFSHWQQSRFSDGSFGVWYGADSAETSVHETVHHWRHGLLRDASFTQPGIQSERKVYQVRCDAALLDLRPAIPHVPALLAGDDYQLTQSIGARLHREGHPGLRTHSARCPTTAPGDIFPIFTPAILSNPRQLFFLTYETTVNGVEIKRDPQQVWLTLR